MRTPCSCANVGVQVCKASCINTPGSYRCSCSKGFKKITSKNICEDINECKKSNGDCEHYCLNILGSRQCSCRMGYSLDSNGRTCTDNDECKRSNGECEHTCTNTPGSRQCSCRRGYRLDSNGRRCTDIDECRESRHRCQHRCRNTMGSFICVCKPGYELNSDKRTCSDINECRRYKGRYTPIATCQQLCTNTVGSYTCGCRYGFEILGDRRTCKDVDECKAGKHLCSQTCINTRGSYICACKAGYELNLDGRSCKALSCEIIKAPLFATMFCTGMSTSHNCSFTCDHGFDIEGPPTLTCMPTRKWSAPTPTCKRKLCRILTPRPNTIVSLPCYRNLHASCYMRCKSGFYSTGSSKATCGFSEDKNSVVWKNDFQCFRVQNCNPNPCHNGGTCIPITSTDFQCDCSNTGYEGRQCEHGIIDMPLFPKLKANLRSSPLTLQANPSKEIQISIHSHDNVVAQPKVIKVTRLKTKAGFTLTSQQPGLKIMSYAIQGESAEDYENPEDDVIFVVPNTPYTKSIFAEIPTLQGRLPVGCHVTQIHNHKCSAKLSSTLPWNQYTNKWLSSQGTVHLITKEGKSIPLSLIGLDFPFSLDGILSKVKQLHQLERQISLKLKTFTKDTCYNATINSPQLMELVENDVFATTFFEIFSTFTPPWITIYDKNEYSVFSLKNIHAFPGSESRTCSSLLNSSSVVSYEPNVGSILTLDEDITLPDERGFCYAIDVCTSEVGFSLPSGSTKAIKSSALFQDMRNAGWDIDLTGAMFPGNEQATVKLETTLWNGNYMKYITSQKYKFAIRVKIKTNIKNKENTNVSLTYQGDIFIDTMRNLNESFRYGFEREVTSVLKGKATMNLTTTVFGKQVTIHFPQRQVVGKSLLGTSTGQGLFFVWRSVPNLLQGTPFNNAVHPTRNQPVFVALEHQIKGGRQSEIRNLNEYNIKVTLISLLLPSLKNLLKNPGMVQLMTDETSKKWSACIHDVENLISDIRFVMKGDLSSASNLNVFLSLITNLRNQIRNIKQLCKVVISVIRKSKYLAADTSLMSQVKRLKQDIPQIPGIRWKRSGITETFKKFKLLFKGKMCSKTTCVEGTNIILESAYANSLNPGKQETNDKSFFVQGKMTQTLVLGPVAVLEKNNHIFLEISREGKTSKLFFNPSISLLGIQKVVTAEIKEDTLSFQTSGLIFGRHQALLKVSAKTDVHDKYLMQYHCVGKLDLSSRLPQIIQRKINNHVIEVAEKAIKRIKNADSESKKENTKLKSFTELLQQKVTTLKKLKEENESLSNNLTLIKMRYNLLKHDLYANIDQDDNESSTLSCHLQECDKVCSMVKMCSYEKELFNFTYDVPNCSEKKRLIKIEKVLQRTVKTFYVEPTFTTQYTGDCGGGWIRDKLFGCDSIYESVRGPDKKVPYTKAWLERVTEETTVKEFDCSNPISKMKVVGRYDFSCNKARCIKVMNTTCISSKLNCMKEYKKVTPKRQLSEYEIRKDKDFKTLKRLANEMEIAAIDIERIKAKLDEAKEELNIARKQKRQLDHATAELKSAASEIRNIQDVKLGLRLWRMVNKKRNDKECIVNITELTFDVTVTDQTILVKREIPVNITFKSLDGTKKSVRVLFDFDNEEISIHKIVATAIRDLYAEKGGARRKRSLSDALEPITTRGNMNMQQVWNNHRRCLKARNAHLFYKDVIRSLDHFIYVREKVEKSNKDNVNKLISLYKTFEKISTGAETAFEDDESDNSKIVFKSYLDFFTLLIKEKKNYTTSWGDVLVIWKTFLEGLTSVRAFLECAGFQDCVVTIGNDLDELYLFESDFARANEIRKSLSYVKNGIVELISTNFTLKEFKNKLSNLKFHLSNSEDTNVLCGGKPKIQFASDKNQVVLENETFNLYCNATSDTNVTYQWIHNNESVIQSENGSLTVRMANKSHAGSYRCKAINRKGFVTSDVIVIITVNSKPQITKHPKDTAVYTKVGPGLLLTCNVTGDPVPDIEWFFVSQYPNNTKVNIYNDNGFLLYYKHPANNYSGYYFCVASNIHGRVESRSARVWVLDMSLGQPRFAVKMNVVKTCDVRNSRLDCWRSRRENTSHSRSLENFRHTLAALLNSSISQVKNISYISDGMGNATVSFLYTSSEPVVKETYRYQMNETVEELLDLFARKRKQLAQGLKLLYQWLKNKTVNENSYADEITGDPESLMVLAVPPGCPRGQDPHQNGYMCVNCPPGKYRDRSDQCVSCPLQTYQYEQGQTECIPCEDGLQTKTTGMTSPKQCHRIRPAPPRNLQATTIGSTKLGVKWQKPNETSEFVRYYLIKYNRPGYKIKTSKLSNTAVNWTLTGLKKFTNYRIAVFAFYSDQKMKSETMVKTGEDVPDTAPVITQGIPLRYDSVRITWSIIPKSKRNGIIRGYKIYYKAGVRGKWLKWQTHTIRPDSVTTRVITGLRSSTWYCFKMSVFTSKGQYPLWTNSPCWMIKTPFFYPSKG